jgi:spore coat protein U-like protein
MNKIKKLLLISSALLLSIANNGFADTTASGTITASGTVTGTCSVTASTMAFTTLSQSAVTTTTASVTPNCTNGTAWTVTNSAEDGYLYLGSNPAATGTSRISMPITLTSGGAAFTLANAATGKLTGLGSGSGQIQSGVLTGTAESASGKVAGVYGSTITLTITY